MQFGRVYVAFMETITPSYAAEIAMDMKDQVRESESKATVPCMSSDCGTSEKQKWIKRKEMT